MDIFRKKSMYKMISFFFWYLPIAVIQLISGKITVRSIPWYETLKKGYWSPPNWVFGPIWTILYLMMAVAIWLVYHSSASRYQYRLACTVFFAQLIVNGLWSFLFFGLHMPGWALLDLFLLIILIAITIICFFNIRPLTGILLVPYLLWSMYASYLNTAIWLLN